MFKSKAADFLVISANFFLLIFTCTYSTINYAQQNPQFSQYLQNPFVINPAITGLEDYVDINAAYRNQWTGLVGSPKTATLSVNSPIALLKGNVQHRDGETHQGIGAFIYNDDVGPIAQGGFYASYAYHLKVSQDWFISMGTFLGATQFKFNDSNVVLIDSQNDDLVQNFSDTNFDMSLGVYVYSKYIFAGIAANQIFNNQINYATLNNQLVTNGTLQRNYNAIFGTRIDINDRLEMIPHLFLKTVQNAPVRWDLGVKMVYAENFWGGLSYRAQDALVGFFGLRIFKNALLSYSYDFALTEFNGQQSGTHEIVLGYRFNFGQDKCKCPKYSL